MVGRICFIAASFCMLFSSSAFTQQKDTTVVPLGEIVVHGARPVTTSGGAAALEVAVDSVMAPPAATVEEILRRIPLVQVRTNSRGEAQFSLRGSGSDARQVAVILDGVPINLGWDHRTDLSVLPTGAATTITVARGLPSLLYGPNTLGGIVEVGLASRVYPGDPVGVQFDAGIDHTGASALAGRTTVSVARANDSIVLRAGGAFRDRSGFALPAGVNDPNGDDDLRSNTDYTFINGFASARYETDRGASLSASTLAFHGDRGIPTELHVSEPRFWRYPDVTRALTTLNAGSGSRASPLGGSARAELNVGVDLGHTSIEQFASASYIEPTDKEVSDDRTLTARLRLDQTMGSYGRIEAGFTYADVNHDEVLTPGGSATYRQRLWSTAIEANTRLPAFSERTQVSLGVALDGADTPETGDKPALSPIRQWAGRAGLRSIVGDRWMLHGGVSWRARFPSLREMYSGALGKFAPNHELRPERLGAFEGGASYSSERAQLQIVAFRHVLSDAIVRISENGKFKRVNRDRQSGTGLELLGALGLGQVTLNGDLVLQRTTLSDDGARTTAIPEYQPEIIAGFGGTGPLPFDIRFEAATRYVGRQQCIHPDTGRVMDLSATKRIDAQVSRTWQRRGSSSSLIVSAAVDNAANDLQYDQCGLPLPGRTLRFQVTLRR